jgi:hypothetical protein
MHQYNEIIKKATYTAKLGKLLAQENIAVEFESEARTACFNPESRTLTLPYSTPLLDTDIQECFLFHEVSHAIHLPTNAIVLVKEANVDHSLFNIVVDIRDERLIKLKYPGCIKTMQIAYEKLLDQEFFGSVDQIPFRSFADRLNVYAKCGMVTGRFIPMSAQENAFYDKCMKAETFDELLELADELAILNENSNNLAGYRTLLEMDFDDDELTADEKKQILEDKVNELKEKTVQDIFDGTIAKSCLTNALVIGYDTFPLADVKVITAQKYIKYVKEACCHQSDSVVTAEVREMRKSISQSVDSMVRVFESKKAAERYKNIKVSDIGLVDINKVYRYKFDDKIFRQNKILPNSKNHAYYILVDLSGSMSRMLPDVIEQIVVITEFFRRIQVPYKVVGFGMRVSSYLQDWRNTKPIANPLPTVIRHINQAEYLMEFMNNTQTTLEHNLAIVGLLNTSGFQLGSTPTGFAICASEQYAMKFFKQCGTTSNHMVVLTDGEPTDITTNRWENRGKTLIVSDNQTKKNFICTGNAQYALINTIGKLFEQRHNIQVSTISLMNQLTESSTSAFVSSRITDQMLSDWRTKGYCKLVDSSTKAEILVAKPFSVDTNVGQIDTDISEKSAAFISRAMLKNLKTVKKSRNFLNALVEKLS